MSGLPPYDLDEPMLAATRADGLPRLALRTVLAPAVVLGRSSVAEKEVHLEACATAGVPVLRRRGGGCAVLLDPGNLVLSLALPVPGFGSIGALWRGITGWLIEGLAAVGLPELRQDGISDLVLGDRKVGGASVVRSQGLAYYATTLLVTPDVALMEQVLAHPPREPAYRRGRPHRAFVGRLGPDLAGVADLRARLEASLRPPSPGSASWC